MSRSKKKNPFHNIACMARGSMKKWKNQCNRTIRREAADPEKEIYSTKKMINRLSAPDDGKSYWDNPKGYRK